MTIDLPTVPAETTVHALSRAGVSLVVATYGNGLPEIVHWGADVGAAPDGIADAARRGVSPSGLDQPWGVSILPTEAEGWAGRPGLVARHGTRPVDARWHDVDVERRDAAIVVVGASDGIRLRSTLSLDEAGVLRIVHEVTNLLDEPLEVTALEATAPAGDTAQEFLDFSGRWTRERSPQRAPLLAGTRARESRRGRTGHDAPMLTAVGTAGFGDGAGTLWAAHLAWSGDAVHRVDALPDADPVIGAAALLRAGEVVLTRGESYRTPDAVFVWSDEGLDGIGARLHRSLRARPEHPSSPRPVTLNTWEAVYFDHRIATLLRLADTAADIGVERFVLDDGWFAGRRSDDAGLGDWRVDDAVWPDGLHPLADHVRRRGMQFGLWVEPEMVNRDSDLARRHPDWLLQPIERGALPWRNQYVLDLSRPDVTEYLLSSLSALVDEYSLDYLKWDQNRDVLEGVGADGARPRLHAHTAAVYRLLDALRKRHPALEIESCASGGARIDLGILDRTDRVWASDTNDPVERLAIQRWTELLLPPELIGSHVGPAVAHTTGRATGLGFRIAAGLFDSLGVEWDISGCTPAELDELRDGIAAYRRLRGLLHTGDLFHLATGDPGVDSTAVLAADRSHAVARVARFSTSERSLPVRLRVPGLAPHRSYRVRPVPELRLPSTADILLPAWLRKGSAVLTGAALGAAGVRLPQLRPAQALVLEIDEMPDSDA